MSRDDFEREVLALWTKSRLPLTRANLQTRTGLRRPQLEAFLTRMVSDGVLAVDSDDDGEMLWIVPGAARPRSGPSTLEDLDRRERLQAQVDGLGSSASMALRAAGLAGGAGAAGGLSRDRKSVIASGALSFFFGPLGWLYAAPLREALPVIVGYLLVCAIVPSFLLVYLMGLINAVSAIVGMLYAWSYNQEGARAPLWGKAKRLLPGGKRR